jgi:hypothetical protein
MGGGEKYVPVFDGVVPVIEWEHKEIHDEMMWFIDYSAAKADTETIEIYFRPSGTRYLSHAMFSADSLLSATWALYEDTDKTYNGSNALTFVNRFRPSKETLQTDVLACHTPGGSGDGTLLATGFCGPSTGPKGPGGTFRRDAELVLKPHVPYLLRITSAANGNVLVGMVNFYQRFHRGEQIYTTTTTTTTTSSSTTTTS